MANEQEEPKVNGAAIQSMVIKLRKVIIANGDEIKEITFREPTAADIERVGNPVNMDVLTSDTPKILFDSRLMTQMMSVLAAVPPSSIRLMHPKDWNNAAWALANFFTP